MAKHYATAVIPVADVEIGFELLLPSGRDGLPPAKFIVDAVKLIDSPGAGEGPGSG